MNEFSENTTPHLLIVPGRCIGAGNCVEQASDYFDQDEDDATVILLREEVVSGDLPRVRRAINVCPVSALALAEPAAS